MAKLKLENTRCLLNEEEGWIYSEFNEVVTLDNGETIRQFDWNVWDLMHGGFVRIKSRESLNVDSIEIWNPIRVEKSYYVELKPKVMNSRQKPELVTYRLYQEVGLLKNPIGTYHYLHLKEEGGYQPISTTEVDFSDWILLEDNLKKDHQKYHNKGFQTSIARAALDFWSYLDLNQQYLLHEWLSFSYQLNEDESFTVVKHPKYRVWDLSKGGYLEQKEALNLRASLVWTKVLTKSETYSQTEFKSLPKLIIREIYGWTEMALKVKFQQLRWSQMTEKALQTSIYLETETGIQPISFNQVNLREWESETAFLTRRIKRRMTGEVK